MGFWYPHDSGILIGFDHEKVWPTEQGVIIDGDEVPSSWARKGPGGVPPVPKDECERVEVTVGDMTLYYYLGKYES